MMGDAAFPSEAVAMMDVTSDGFSLKRTLSWPFIFMLCRLYNVCEVHQRKLQQLLDGESPVILCRQTFKVAPLKLRLTGSTTHSSSPRGPYLAWVFFVFDAARTQHITGNPRELVDAPSREFLDTLSNHDD